MIYFLSDAHLGSRIIKNPRQHEMKLVQWLDTIKVDAKAVFLLGDIFDFWFEYNTVVPKGYVRFLGKLAELTDAGIEVHFFIGNHDIWTFGYLEKEVGLIVHKEPVTLNLYGKNFFMAHGDGLQVGDKGFALLRNVFHSKTAQRLFRMVPPQLGQEFGYRWSKSNRERILHLENNFLGEDKEHLVIYAKHYAQHHDVDFLIFGHRHIALDLQITNGKRVVILGDFVSIFTYGMFDGQTFSLEYFE